MFSFLLHLLLPVIGFTAIAVQYGLAWLWLRFFAKTQFTLSIRFGFMVGDKRSLRKYGISLYVYMHTSTHVGHDCAWMQDGMASSVPHHRV